MKNILASLGMWLTRRFGSVRPRGDLSIAQIEEFLLSRGWIKLDQQSTETYDEFFVWVKHPDDLGMCWSLALEVELDGNPWTIAEREKAKSPPLKLHPDSEGKISPEEGAALFERLAELRSMGVVEKTAYEKVVNDAIERPEAKS